MFVYVIGISSIRVLVREIENLGFNGKNERDVRSHTQPTHPPRRSKYIRPVLFPRITGLKALPPSPGLLLSSSS